MRLHINLRFALFFMLVSLLPAGPPATAQERPVGPAGDMPLDSAVTIGRLENGLTFYIRENKEPANRAELRLVVNAGSILEDEDQLGLAHFVEHMAFNGTKNFAKQDLVNYLELIGARFGADLNASTSFDETIYKLRIPTDDRKTIEKGFQVLADWAAHVSFDDDEVEKERGVVIEEWRIGRGATARMFEEKQFPVLVQGSRYASRLPIGTKASLESFTAKAAKRFYRDWYRPDLMAVVAVGDFNRADIEKLIRRTFRKLRMRQNPRERRLYPVPDHEELLFGIATDPEATQTVVSLYFKHPPEEQATHRAYRETIVAGLFNRMLNDRFGEIVQKPGAPFLYASSDKRDLLRTKSAYSLTAVVRDNGIIEGLRALLVEAERVKRFGFTESELARQKRELLRSIQQLYEQRHKHNSADFAAEFIRSFLTGEGIPGIAYEYALYQRYLPDIALEEVNRLAQVWMTDSNRVLLISAPEKNGVQIPSEAELRAVLDAVQALALSPYEDEVADAPLLAVVPKPSPVVRETTFSEIDVTEWRLANGVRVLLKPTDFKEDELLFTAYSPGGTSLAADSLFIPAATAASVVQGGGAGNFNSIQLQKVLAGKLANVRAYIGTHEEGLSGGASPRDAETLFQLIYLRFTKPRKDSIAFFALRSRIKDLLKNRGSNPEAAFEDTLQVTLAQYHPRARPISSAYFDAMDLERSYAFYKDRFADASDFTFIFVGNFVPDSLQPLVETYLGGLPSLNRQEGWRDVGMRPPRGVIEKHVIRGTEPKALTRIVFTGPFEWNRWNRYVLRSMIEILRIRLREALREDLGGTYGVNVLVTTAREPEPGYRIEIGFGCDPARLTELTFVAFEEMRGLQEDGPQAENVQKVKEIQRREYETALRSNRAWLQWLEFYSRHGEDLRGILAYKALVDRLKPVDIQRAALQYLNTNNYVQVSLLPEKN